MKKAVQTIRNLIIRLDLVTVRITLSVLSLSLLMLGGGAPEISGGLGG